jgi:hypothetical protein
VLSSPALAGEPTADDRAVARLLFDEGRGLMKDGKYAEAVPKLEESQRLDAGVGTLFNLADCYEHVGRTSSAWAAFAEAADLAKRAGQDDREAAARERANLLAPKLAKVRVHMPPPLPPSLELQYDDKPLSLAILDTDMPVDPGDHRIKASAPGKVPAEQTIHVEAGAPLARVELPVLADAPSTNPIGPPPNETPPSEGGSWQKPAAIAAGVGALVGIGVGTIFGLKASSDWSDAQKTCADKKCDAAGYSKWQDSRSSATIGTVGFVAGGVLAAAAVLLFVTAPSEKSAPPAAPPSPPANAQWTGSSRFFAGTSTGAGATAPAPFWRLP